MTTFIRTGTARKQPNITSSLKTQADEYIAAHANPDTGTVTDPSVYDKAIKLLGGDNTPAGLKAKFDYQNAQSKLTSKLNDAYATKGMLDYNFKNAQYNVGKAFALNPAQMIQHMYELYDFHGAQIENHVKQLQADGKSATALQTYGGTIADEAAKYEKLFDAINQHGIESPQTKQETQNFGMAIGTDSEGKITSFALHVIPSGTQDARMTLKGANDSTGTTYVRTASTYGGIPLYVIPKSDPNDPTGNTYVAKVGNLQFSGTKKAQGQDALKLTDTRPWYQKLNPITGIEDVVDRATSALSGGGFKRPNLPTEADQEIMNRQGAATADRSSTAVDLFSHIKPEDFSNMTSLPAGSIAHTIDGTYYYVGDDGKMVQAPNADILSKNIGIPAKQIQSASMPISSQDLERLQGQQNPDDRANAWMSDPTESSPLNMNAGPTSMTTSSNQPGLSIATPAAPPGGAPLGPPAPASEAGPRAIQQPHGAELAQKNTQKIVGPQPPGTV